MSTILRHIAQYPEGMTVKELKELVKDWPEIGEDGEPLGVWLGNSDGTSSPAFSASSLNTHALEDGTLVADFILE